MLTSRLRFPLLGLGAVLVGACAQLLGDDFTIGATGGAGSSSSATAGGGAEGGGNTQGGGGASSSAGGMGGTGGSPLPFTCEWQLTQHREIAKLPIADTFGRMVAVRMGNDSLRVFVMHHSMTAQSMLEVYGIDSSTKDVSQYDVRDLHDGIRIDNDEIAALVTKPPATGGPSREYHLLRVDDDDFNGDAAVFEPVAVSSALADPSGENYRFDGAMALTAPPGVSMPPIDLLVVHETSNDYRVAFGRYSGSVVDPIEIDTALAEADARINDLLHNDDVAYAFLGENGGPLGLREYQMGTTGLIDERTFPANTLYVDLQITADVVNTAMAVFDTPLQLYTGAIDHADLGDYALDDLGLAAELNSFAELPVEGGQPKWFADLLLMLGGTPLDETELKYLLFDVNSNERGGGELPFTAVLAAGVQRTEVGEFAVVPKDTVFTNLGGDLHVVWTESQIDPAISSTDDYDVLYYDVLRCLVVEE